MRFPLRSLVTAVLAATSVVAASAASLGGVTTAKLTGTTMSAGSTVPTVVAWENFTGANGAAISGTVTNGGSKTWSQFGGTWTVQGNQARSTSAAPSGLIVNTGSQNGSAEATIRLNSGTYDVELIFNSNATGTEFIGVDFLQGSGGTISIWKYANGWTSLASLTNFPPASPFTMRIESASNGVIRGYVNGMLKVSYTLTGPEQTTYKNASHTYAGIVAYNDATSTFDDFHADQP